MSLPLVGFVHQGGASNCDDSLGCHVTTREGADAITSNGTDDVIDAAGDAPALAAGTAVLELSGAGRSGLAVVTVSTANGVEDDVEVVMHSGAANVDIAVDENSIQVGGSTFIVATVTDKGGQPVSSAIVEVGVEANAPTGPEANSVTVDIDDDIGRPRPGPAPAIPSCNAGTDGQGQCAVKVYAPQKGADADAGTVDGDAVGDADGGTDQSKAKYAADRGEHTVTLVVELGGDRLATDSASFMVSGAPDGVSTDAPSRVDALSSTTITITVEDDETVRVGAVGYSIDQLEGEGKITAGETDKDSKTRDGQAKFTYRAPRSGTALFLVTVPVGASSVTHTIEITIGAAPVEAPDAPPATWSAPLASGTHNLVWNGDDGADVADGSAEGVTAIWQWNGTGWDGYFPAAADVPGGNTLDELTNGAAYWVIVE